MSVKDARERRQCQGFQELRVIGNHTRREENEGFRLMCSHRTGGGIIAV